MMDGQITRSVESDGELKSCFNAKSFDLFFMHVSILSYFSFCFDSNECPMSPKSV